MRMTKRERKIRFRHLKRMYRIEEAKAKQENKVSGRFMNRVVVTMILAVFIYTVIMMIVFVQTGSEPSTLTEKVFDFCSVEGGALALIKIAKTALKPKPNGESKKQHENETEHSEEVRG